MIQPIAFYPHPPASLCLGRTTLRNRDGVGSMRARIGPKRLETELLGRNFSLLQSSATRPADRLGVSTNLIYRNHLWRRKVAMPSGVSGMTGGAHKRPDSRNTPVVSVRAPTDTRQFNTQGPVRAAQGPDKRDFVSSSMQT
jgi:hypothetical protein